MNSDAIATCRRQVHLVGSVGLSSAEEVFRTVGSLLGGRLKRLPDGETGSRGVWVLWPRKVLEENPAFEVDPVEAAAGGRITSEIEGLRKWGGGNQVSKGAPPPPRMRLKPGTRLEDVRLRSLGYAAVAQESYATFVKLRDGEGAIPAGTRFLVSLPTTAAFLNAHVSYSDHSTVEPIYRARLFEEVAEICRTIPHQDLAIQWDVSTEMGQLEGVRHAHFADVETGVAERLATHCNAVPREVQLGVHLCYGSYGNRHWMEPKDTRKMVALFNRLLPRLSRSIEWLHLPVPVNRDDDAYYEPLRELARPEGMELYLGLIHDSDGLDGTRKRIAVAEQYVQDFGVATECGFGRRPPETIPALLQLHADL